MNIKTRLEKLEAKILTDDYIVYYPTFEPDGSIYKRINNGDPVRMSKEDAEAEMAGYENDSDFHRIEVNFGGEQ